MLQWSEWVQIPQAHLNALSPVGTIVWEGFRKVGLLERGMPLGWAWGFQKTRAVPNILLPASHSWVKMGALSYYSIAMPACLLPCSPPECPWIVTLQKHKIQTNAFFFCRCLSHGVLSEQQKNKKDKTTRTFAPGILLHSISHNF